MLYIQEPHWYEEAIKGHGSVEVNIIHAIFTGGSRVGKTSLKHYLLHNTAREDKTSTGVLEAPEVATIEEDQTISREFEEERCSEEEGQKREGKGMEDKGNESQEKEGKGMESQGMEGQRMEGQGKEGKEKEGKEKEDKGMEGQEKEGKEKEGKGMEGQGMEGQGKEGQGMEGQGMEGQEKEGKGMEGQRMESQGMEGKEKEDKGMEGQGMERKGKKGQGIEGQRSEDQGMQDQREEKHKDREAYIYFTKGIAVGSSWKVMDDVKLGQLISQIDMEKTKTFPSNTPYTTDNLLSQATAIVTDQGKKEKVPFLKKVKILKRLFKRKQKAKQSNVSPISAPTQDLHHDSSPINQDPLQLLEQARESFLKKHRLSAEAKFDEMKCTFIYLLDTGGQHSFQNVLPLLLDFPCNFLHVFKASEKLTDPHVNAFCRDGTTEEKRANSRSTWELMKESITAAYTMSMKSKRQLKAFDVAADPQLRIFLVGTHLSHLPEDLEAERALLDHNKRVLEDMDHKPYDGNRVFPPKEVVYKGAGSYFLLDSQLQGDSKMKDHTCKVVNALRSQLADFNSRLALKVPKIWFCLQLITSSVKKKMWKLTELKEFCIRYQYIQPVDADGQLLALLNLFHCLGFYVYFNLSECKEQWICTDATFLYKEISKVLSVQYGPENEYLVQELRIFKETGVIPEAVSEALFQRLGIDADIPTRWLLEVLLHVGIAAKVVEETKMHFFIPTVLPERNISLPTESVATLGFTFLFHSVQYQSYSCVPTGLFHRLAVDMASTRQAHKVNRAYVSGNQWRYCPSQSGSTQFIFSQENAHIVLSQKEDLIQLQLLVPKHFSTLALSLTELCKHIREEMEEHIRYVSKRVFDAEFLEEKATLEVGVICHHQNCRTSSLHLLRFEGDNQRTGLCTRLNKTTGLTPRESVWVAKEQDSNTSSVSDDSYFSRYTLLYRSV